MFGQSPKSQEAQRCFLFYGVTAWVCLLATWRTDSTNSTRPLERSPTSSSSSQNSSSTTSRLEQQSNDEGSHFQSSLGMILSIVLFFPCCLSSSYFSNLFVVFSLLSNDWRQKLEPVPLERDRRSLAVEVSIIDFFSFVCFRVLARQRSRRTTCICQLHFFLWCPIGSLPHPIVACQRPAELLSSMCVCL